MGGQKSQKIDDVFYERPKDAQKICQNFQIWFRKSKFRNPKNIKNALVHSLRTPGPALANGTFRHRNTHEQQNRFYEIHKIMSYLRQK